MKSMTSDSTIHIHSAQSGFPVNAERSSDQVVNIQLLLNESCNTNRNAGKDQEDLMNNGEDDGTVSMSHDNIQFQAPTPDGKNRTEGLYKSSSTIDMKAQSANPANEQS